MTAMHRRHFQHSLVLAGLSPWLAKGVYAQREAKSTSPESVAEGGCVAATVHPIASQAAQQMFAKSGNAIDAAVAAALCLSVVDGHNSGIGGGCLILIRSANGNLLAIDGRETAPGAATPDMFLRDGKPNVELSQTGPLACGVPGQVAALQMAHEQLGALPWAQLFEPAIDAAENGYAIGRATHAAIASESKDLRKFPASRDVLLRRDQSPLAIGDRLVQPDLARTLRLLATHGQDWFYRGEFAKACAEHLQSLGGVMTVEDFARYRAVQRKPLRTRYRNHQVIGFPTPSSGGIHIAQMLNMLSQFDVRSIHAESPSSFYHLLAECMLRAFADRAHWLGDSDFVDVPDFLLDPAYSEKLAKEISMDRATADVQHGDGLQSDEKKHTTHFTTADDHGNWVAITATVNTSWGCKIIVPGTGVMLNNEMDDFSIAPGVPNAFGLVGSAANSVEAYKRPLSSMSPTIVLDEASMPVMTCGAAGGPKIINATLQNIVRTIDLQESIDQAIGSARIHQQWRPNVVVCEPNLGGPRQAEQTPENTERNNIAMELKRLGHSVQFAPTLAIAQGIQRLAPNSAALRAASDPRTQGQAIAWG